MGGGETMIPLGGGGGGGGFSLPLDPSMFAGPGQGQPMGFEETEEIGPDGKPHIISEKSFNPGGPAPKLTKAQKRQQKAMQKEMAAMAQDMGQMFQGGGFGGIAPMRNKPVSRKAQRKAAKAEQDLFKNAMKAFNQADQGQMKGMQGSQLPLINPGQQSSFPNGVAPRKSGAKVPNGWEVTGNSYILNQAGIVVASCVILGAILLVGFRYYKQRGYTPVTEEGIENAPFRSL